MDQRNAIVAFELPSFRVAVLATLAGCRVQIGNDGMGGTDPGTPGVEWYDPDPELLRTDGASSNTDSEE
ncbi:MAG: hypothetical protein H8E44_00225 [Planctomycetes bacterium]|nr:hypothetical protein [Planctomycetota bacterium]MBL7043655.1 hypothetical protein [Pirellulaceae bacterium]